MPSSSSAKAVPHSPAHEGRLLIAFGATLFASAFLLFAVQPLFAKMVLPKLGGSPAVWSFALVFFQATLLAGYAYAHVLTKAVGTRTAAAFHALVLAAGLAALPLALPEAWSEAAGSGDRMALAAVFCIGVGLPFFAVSATAPLLQSWFSRTGHPHAADPYFLYGASNLGSFLALAAYPFIIEPMMALSSQTSAWSVLYGALAICVLGCGAFAAMFADAGQPDAAPENPAAKILAKDVAIWVALAAVPSGLLVSVTAHITTDVVAAPFMWVLPLALFLLTFVIVFKRNPVISHGRALWLQTMAVAPFAAILFSGKDAEFLMIGLHLAAFFISAMVCHGALAARRPDARHLTAFYLAMSFGGVIGGFFASILAPMMFTRIYEYPILLACTFLCRADVWRGAGDRLRSSLAAPAMGALIIAAFALIPAAREAIWAANESYGIPGLVAFTIAVFVTRRMVAVQAGLVIAGIALMTVLSTSGIAIKSERSLFGVHSVESPEGGAWHVLKHGTTSHGSQRWLDANGLRAGGMPEPAAYYHPRGSIAGAIDAMRAARGGAIDVAVIGLGSGAMACHRKGNETWRFFEIDAKVVKIARDPALFTYLEHCASEGDVVIGDGRLKIAAEKQGAFDVIVVDAFSSDAIPVHLLTKEAVELYRSKLKSGGAIVFHISNRFMSLAEVVSATAGGAVYTNTPDPKDWPFDPKKYQHFANVAVAFEKPDDGRFLGNDPKWQLRPADPGQLPWTDDYSNVLGAIARMFWRG
jgi:hypothetical protein